MPDYTIDFGPLTYEPRIDRFVLAYTIITDRGIYGCLEFIDTFFTPGGGFDEALQEEFEPEEIQSIHLRLLNYSRTKQFRNQCKLLLENHS